MNWTIEFIEENGFVLIEAEGHFTGQDNMAMLEDLLHQEYWKPDTSILLDNRRRDYDDDGLAFVKKSSLNFIKKNAAIGCSKIAILMKSVADFGLGREFELLTDEEMCADVRVFLNEKQAFNWIRS